MRFILTFLLLAAVPAVFAQHNTLKIRIAEDAPLTAYIYLNQGNTLIPVDSIMLGKGTFTFNTSKYAPGIYSFVLSEEMYIRFIVNNEDVELATSLESVTDSLKVIQSEENKLYYQYLRLREDHTKMLAAINTLLANPNKSKRLAKVLTKEKARREMLYDNAIRSIINSKGSLMVSQVILSELPVIAPENLSPVESRQYLISSWWSSFPFDYPNIVNTPGISDKLWDYFDLFYDDEASRTEQISYFKRVIDEVLNQPGIAPEVYDYFRNDMLKTFMQSSYTDLTSYINTNYPAISPSHSFEQEFDQLMLSAIGQKAADFTIVSDSAKVNLYDLKNRATILIFWSMDCSHCRSMIPELRKSAKDFKKKGIDLVMINLDAYRPAWKLYVKENQIPGYNMNIQNPFNSEITSKYNVAGTPVMYVIDENKVITGKPSSIKELLKAAASY